MTFEELHYIIGRPGELITDAGNYITSAALSGTFMPCVCVMHCRRRFFFGKNDVPGIFMPCVCVMHCRRRFFFRKSDVPGHRPRHGGGGVQRARRVIIITGNCLDTASWGKATSRDGAPVSTTPGGKEEACPEIGAFDRR